jgi:excisionase family DNA binding protein
MPTPNNATSDDHKGRSDKNLGDTTMAEEPERLLTVREVARQLRVDDTTVRRWIKSGSLEAITLPHRGRRQAYRIKQSTLDKLLKGPRLPG